MHGGLRITEKTDGRTDEHPYTISIEYSAFMAI